MSQTQHQNHNEQQQPGTAAEDQPTQAAQAAQSVQSVQSVQAVQPTVMRRIESKFPRGLVIRLIAYLFVGHLFAFFVYLLFVLGGQNQ